jgi:hypothetical protein
VTATLGGPYDGREIAYPTAPDDIVPGYEAVIGGQERPSSGGDKYAGEYSAPAKGSRFTRRRFLKAAGAGAAYLALAGTVGSEPVESYPKIRSLRTPKV